MTTPVLYISYDGMTDPLGQSQVLPYLKGLSARGYKFHLISFEKEERFDKNKKVIQSICDEAGITWHPLSYTKKPPLLSTLYDVQRMNRLAFKLHKEHDFKIVHCRSYLSALVGLKLKRKKGVRFLFDMRGFWADERIDGKIWSLESPIFKRVYSYFKKKELEFFKNADYTISLTHNAKNEIESWKEFSSKKPMIEVIPCCVDLELFNPATIDSVHQNELRSKLHLSASDNVLGYVGSIGTWYMLDEMLDYFKILLNKKPNSKFLFVTAEPKEMILKKAKEKDISKDSMVVVSCLHKEVPLYISLFDASIFFIIPSYSKKASSPTKQGEIMAMGIPLICNTGVGDTDLVVKKYNAGLVIDEFTNKVYEGSLDFNTNFNLLDTMHGAKEFYGLENGVNSYEKVYKYLLEL